MSIPFTQYLLPHGRKASTSIDMPDDVEAMAQRFIEAGGWFESEMLTDLEHVSLTACWNTDDGPNDIAIEVVRNGPDVPVAVDRLVRKAVVWADKA